MRIAIGIAFVAALGGCTGISREQRAANAQQSISGAQQSTGFGATLSGVSVTGD